MRALIVSNSPHIGTAYGLQTRMFTHNLSKFGVTVAVACNFGVDGAAVGSNPKIYPASPTRGGDANVWAAALDFQPDLIISLYDVWALEFYGDPRLIDIPWVAWATVDSAPLDPRSQKILSMADGVVAYSKFGFDTMTAAGLKPVYIPLGIDTALFTPGDKAIARAGMKHPATGEDLTDKFIFGMVGRNNTAPSRKGFDVALLAFAAMRAKHPDAFLYLHTCRNKQDRGLDLNRMVEELQLTNSVFFCNDMQERLGFSDAYMANMYRSLDVLLQPSMAEGFGLPILEAAASGVPTIATDHSSMTELVQDAGGWLIRHQPVRMIQETWFARPNIDSLTLTMKKAYGERGAELDERGKTARRFAEGYDFAAFTAPAWYKYIEGRSWM